MRGTGEILGLLKTLLLRHRVLLSLRSIVGNGRGGREGRLADEGNVAGRRRTRSELESPAVLPDGRVALGGGVGDLEGRRHRLVAPVVAFVRGDDAGVGDDIPVPLAPPNNTMLEKLGCGVAQIVVRPVRPTLNNNFVGKIRVRRSSNTSSSR